LKSIFVKIGLLCSCIFWTLKMVSTSFFGEIWSPSSPHKLTIFRFSLMIFLLLLIDTSLYLFLWQIDFLSHGTLWVLQVVIVLAIVLLAVDFLDQQLWLFYFILLVVLLVLSIESAILAKRYKNWMVFLETTLLGNVVECGWYKGYMFLIMFNQRFCFNNICGRWYNNCRHRIFLEQLRSI